jgi:hypothetical protein
MSDIINALVHSYIDLWNDRDPGHRKDAIDALLTDDSLYTDPDWEAVTGPDAINTMIAQAQDKLGDLRFTLAAIINTHHDLVLFTWRLGLPDGSPPVATGYDIAEFGNGKIRCLYGFFD